MLQTRSPALTHTWQSQLMYCIVMSSRGDIVSTLEDKSRSDIVRRLMRKALPTLSFCLSIQGVYLFSRLSGL